MRHPDYDGAEEYEATKAHLKEGPMRHTEGPWWVRRLDSLGRWQVWKGGSGRVHRAVATLNPDLSDEANAHLIAASPKLLDACKEAAQAIVEMEDMDHVQRMEWFETTGLDLYDLLRAAIEKAEATP